MKKGPFLKILSITTAVLILSSIGIYYGISRALSSDPFMPLYVENCSSCHGEDMAGGALGRPLVGGALVHGDTVADLSASIARGFPQKGMPGWSDTLSEAEIRSLAILIAERRVNRRFTDFRTSQPLEIPLEPIKTELATFRLEIVATGLDPFPFSIAPLPDGNILLTEKKRGLSVISPHGVQSALIEHTPKTSDVGFEVLGLDYGLGWHLDVKPHPDYPHNGWIYLLHTDLCSGCGDGEEEDGLIPKTMNRLVRGRIKDGAWVDEEVIWRVAREFYTSMPDIAAGGRIAFDPEGYVFLSVGIKALSNYLGVQDLATPYGKIHRIRDDGEIPTDNPFIDTPGAQSSIWSYGHRSPQGLEFDPVSRQLWGSEMGPRGGDEINLLEAGRNYGWPLYSKGVDYDGTPVEYWKDLGIEFNLNDIEQPVVDLTPSPAVSSFVIYDADLFPAWRGSFIVGSLKATELYRVVIEDGVHVHTELLLRDLARIRDVEIGYDGLIYLLLEHETGSQIVRLAPMV
ncbi:MAG: PQQ-dependent sugar dehydrogenase [Pseudomonadales bacterium]|nr:PQQ-dependent sugar dehydrogenase [Pseudomonadales bacterium]